MQGPGRGSEARPARAREARRRGGDAALRAGRGLPLGGNGRCRPGLRRHASPTTPSFWRRGWRAIVLPWSSSGTWPWSCRGRPSTRRSSTFAWRAPTARAATTRATSSTASTTRSATCAGPSSGTWSAFLSLVAEGKIRPAELITHRFELGEAERAFESPGGGGDRGRGRARLPAEQGAEPASRRPANGRRRRPPRDGRRLGVDRGGLVRDRNPDPRARASRLRAGRRRLRVGAVGGERAAPLRVRDRPRPGRGDPLPGRSRPGRDRHPSRLPRGARRPGPRRGAGGLRREAAGARLGTARAGQGCSASLRGAAAGRLQSPLRAAGHRAAALAWAEADGLPRERRSPGSRSLAQRPRHGGRSPEGRGMPLHRLHLRSGGKRPAQRQRARLPVGAGAPAGGDRQLQRPDHLRRRRGWDGPLRGGRPDAARARSASRPAPRAPTR